MAIYSDCQAFFVHAKVPATTFSLNLVVLSGNKLKKTEKTQKTAKNPNFGKKNLKFRLFF